MNASTQTYPEMAENTIMTAPARREFRPFTPAEPQRAFDIIATQLRDRLKSGELRPGDRLPAERELGEHFQVSRNTLREAILAKSPSEKPRFNNSANRLGKQPTFSRPIGCGPPKKSEPMPT